MSETPYSPTTRRLRLAAELRQLRADARLTATQAARRAGIPSSKLARLEQGQVDRPKPEDIEALLDVYAVTAAPKREELVSLARDTRYRGWWRGYRDVFRGVLPDLEAGASHIRCYEALYIPGLLQTPEYAAAIFRVERHGEADVARRVGARLARQQILDREHPPTLQVLIDEAALRKRVGGPRVMHDQLMHLVNSSARPNVSLRVVPDDLGAHPGMMGAFVLLDFPSPDDPRMVYIESARTSLCMDTSNELVLYEGIFNRVAAVALPGEESVRLIADMAVRLAEVANG